ncbi:MAG: T9SS type A sorting domain-containing protein [Flavobacteriales bacterium]|nr:T9SS type A sorting domain-containing protein [Flavobacteriales bacterium]
MKKIYFLALGLFAAGAVSAQNDTLIWENFNGESWTEGSTETELITEVGNTIVYELSPGATGDDKWYNIDLDGLTPNNPNQGNEWFRALAFADQDSVDGFDAVFAATSWFTPFAQANNWLVTPSFYCSSDAVLSWYSASFQTPLFLDGYKVKVSTLTNDPSDFTTTIFTAKEFVTRTAGDSCSFGVYTFAPSGAGFVHGQDGTYTEPNTDNDCTRLRGRLHPHSVNLSQFAGQRIYIAFVHDTDDDNLISVDNILVKGTFVDDASINEVNNVSFSAYPNPATDFITLGFQLNAASDVNIRVIDNLGRMVSAKDLTNQSGNNSVTVDVANLAAGVYTISLETAAGKSTKKFVKK